MASPMSSSLATPTGAVAPIAAISPKKKTRWSSSTSRSTPTALLSLRTFALRHLKVLPTIFTLIPLTKFRRSISKRLKLSKRGELPRPFLTEKPRFPGVFSGKNAPAQAKRAGTGKRVSDRLFGHIVVTFLYRITYIFSRIAHFFASVLDALFHFA